jgi:DNA mismatch repair protein MutS
MSHKTLTEEYCDECDACVCEFKEPNIDVFMKVGTFYEMYMVDVPVRRGGDLATVATITNLQISRKNTKIDTPADYKNPYFVGFPAAKVQRYVQMMIAEQRIVVLYDQVPGEGMSNRMMRMREGVYTSSTWIDGEVPRHVTCHCVLEKCGCDAYAGLCFVDVVEGTVDVYEENGEEADVADRLTACFIAQRPNDVVFHVAPAVAAEKNVEAKFGLWHLAGGVSVRPMHQEIPVTAINEILRRVWPSRGGLMVSVVESLGLNRLTGGLQALALALETLGAYHPQNIHRLDVPRLRACNEDNMLTLQRDALLQLGIFRADGKRGKFRSSQKSIFELLDCCRTRLGKRHLEYVLSHPFAGADEIVRRHDRVSWYLSRTEVVTQVRDTLHGIGDVQVVMRKWCRGTLGTTEFLTMHGWINNMITALSLCGEEVNEDVQEFVDTVAEVFVVERMCGFSDVRVKGIDEAFDRRWTAFADCHKRFIHFVKRFRLKNGLDASSVHLELADDGYVLKTAKKIGREKLIGMDTVPAKTGWILHNNDVDAICHDMNNLRDEVLQMNKDALADCFRKYFDRYAPALKTCFTRIAELDMLTSHAFVCREWGLTRPTLLNDAHSGVNCVGLKNMIVTNTSDTACIPVDISIGIGKFTETRGVVLHGMNSSGKSTLIKSLGAAVILAQAGLYVPCEAMTLVPFGKLITQVEFHDDIHRGHSSFCVEMQGLDAMLRCMDEKTLIMADELTRGTEQRSSISIFCAAVKCMQDAGARFLMSSHLTELEPNMKHLNVDMDQLRVCHFAHELDKHGDIVFTRLLANGRGPTVYGVRVAEHIIKSPSFIKYANEVCDALSSEPKLTRARRSRYNGSKVLMACEICGGQCTETHHISPQKDADAHMLSPDGNNVHALHNLVALCHECHERVHRGGIVIDGYVQTLRGRKLSYV